MTRHVGSQHQVGQQTLAVSEVAPRTLPAEYPNAHSWAPQINEYLGAIPYMAIPAYDLWRALGETLNHQEGVHYPMAPTYIMAPPATYQTVGGAFSDPLPALDPNYFGG